MRGAEHSVYLFLNDVSKTLSVNQTITANKSIYNLFGSDINYKPHYIFKSKSYEFHNSNIGLLSVYDTRMDGYFTGMHKYLRMRKSFFTTVSSAGSKTMSLNSKLSKVVSYIQDNKSWGRIYVFFGLLSLFLWVLCLADSNKAGMDKFVSDTRMKNISIIKSSSNIDNKELLPLS